MPYILQLVTFVTLASCVGYLGGLALRCAANRRDCRLEGHVWRKDRPGVERCVRCKGERLVDEPPCKCSHDRFNHVWTGHRDECAVVGCPCASYVPDR